MKACALLFASVLLMTQGCATKTALRTSETVCVLDQAGAPNGSPLLWEAHDPACASAFAVRARTHGVNYVEIDEQGILVSRLAMERALEFAGAPTANGRPAYVVVFVHGWHHDASADDSNVAAFHGALAAAKAWHPDDEVRGIYIGWRGKSLDLPLLRYLTFWDRKNTSDEVGRGALLEFLLRLERVVKPPPETLPSPAEKQATSSNKLILVGHSFGASVAFNALAHVFLERFISGVYSNEPGPRFRGYGDLTVLINPAIEAMRYMPFQSAIDYYTRDTQVPLANFDHDELPRLVILSSLGDWATRATFPAARFFSIMFEHHERISTDRSPDPAGRYHEWVLDRDTVGNGADVQTHWPIRILEPSPGSTVEVASAESSRIKPLTSGIQECRLLPKAEVRRLLSIETAENAKIPVAEFPDSHLRVPRKPSRIKWAPYIVAAVGKEIIEDHSSIDSQNLICWINQLAGDR